MTDKDTRNSMAGDRPPNHIPLDFEAAIEGLLQVDPREPEQSDQPEEKKAEKNRKGGKK